MDSRADLMGDQSTASLGMVSNPDLSSPAGGAPSPAVTIEMENVAKEGETAHGKFSNATKRVKAAVTAKKAAVNMATGQEDDSSASSKRTSVASTGGGRGMGSRQVSQSNTSEDVDMTKLKKMEKTRQKYATMTKQAAMKLLQQAQTDDVDLQEVDGESEGGGGDGRKIEINLKDVEFVAHAGFHLEALVRELFVYLFFALTTLAVIFLARDVSGAFETQFALRDALLDEEFSTVWNHKKTFFDIATPEEFWEWAEGPLTDALTGDNIRGEPYRVYQYNRIIGAVRFRQLRVTNDSCKVSSQFWEVEPGDAGYPGPGVVSKACYNRFFDKFQEEEPFTGVSSGDTYTWSSAGDTGSLSTWGRYIEMSFIYPGSGFTTDIPLADFKTTVTKLKDDRWIDLPTRAIFITLYALNPNLNYVSQMHMVFEMLPGGSIMPWVNFRQFKLALYKTTEDRIRLVLELIMVAFIIYYLVGETRFVFRRAKREHEQAERDHQKKDDEMKNRLQMDQDDVALTDFDDDDLAAVTRDRGWPAAIGRALKSYFSSLWNIVEVVNLFLFFVFICIRASYMFNGERKVDVSRTDFLQLESLAQTNSLGYQVLVVNVFLTYMKFFKYLRFNNRMTLLWGSLSRASSDLLIFGLFFMLVTLGFSTSGYLLFGATLPEYRDFGESLSAASQIFLGVFDYAAMQDVNRILAPLYFFTYVLLIFFVLSNVFIGIITDAYSEVHKMQKPERDPWTAIRENIADIYYQSRYFFRRWCLCNKDAMRPSVHVINQRIRLHQIHVSERPAVPMQAGAPLSDVIALYIGAHHPLIDVDGNPHKTRPLNTREVARLARVLRKVFDDVSKNVEEEQDEDDLESWNTVKRDIQNMQRDMNKKPAAGRMDSTVDTRMSSLESQVNSISTKLDLLLKKL